jgi:hypothetical protein
LRRYLFSLLVLLTLSFTALAQVNADTTPPLRMDTAGNANADTATAVPPTIRRWSDSVSKRPVEDKSWRLPVDSLSFAQVVAEVFAHHPWVGFGSRPEKVHGIPRVVKGKELMFYTMIGLLLIFAILRSAFQNISTTSSGFFSGQRSNSGRSGSN